MAEAKKLGLEQKMDEWFKLKQLLEACKVEQRPERRAEKLAAADKAVGDSVDLDEVLKMGDVFDDPVHKQFMQMWATASPEMKAQFQKAVDGNRRETMTGLQGR